MTGRSEADLGWASLERAARTERFLATWMPPLIVAAIAVAIVAGFYLGGPGLGMAVGALAASSILVLAARKPPLASIVPPPARDRRRHVLVVLGAPLGDPAASDALAALLRGHDQAGRAPDVLVLGPCRSRFLERWTSDTRPGLERAQRDLVVTIAALAAIGIEARARLGEEDLTQAIEDELRSFPASEVILVGAGDRRGKGADVAVRGLRPRLRVPLRLVAAGPDRAAGEAARGALPSRCK